MSFISLMCFTIVLVINGSLEESNSGCDSQSMADLTIDSTILIPEKNKMYFFTDWMATEVNVTNGEIVSKKITELFDFNDRVKDFKPPVDLAMFSQINETLVLRLVANTIVWDISLTSLELINDTKLVDSSLLLDVIPIDQTSVYYNLRFDGIKIILKKSGSKEDLTLQKFEKLNVTGTQIRLIAVNDLSLTGSEFKKTKLIYELNGHNITSGVVIPQDMNISLFQSGKLVLFADRFFIEVSQSLNESIPFVVKTNQLICSAIQYIQNPSNTPNYITFGTDKTAIPEQPTNTNVLVIIISVVILVLVLAIGTAIVIALNCKKKNKRLILKPTNKPNIEGNKEPNEELSDREMSGVFDANSNTDYSKSISVTPSSSSAETSLIDKPTDLKVN